MSISLIEEILKSHQSAKNAAIIAHHADEEARKAYKTTDELLTKLLKNEVGFPALLKVGHAYIVGDEIIIFKQRSPFNNADKDNLGDDAIAIKHRKDYSPYWHYDILIFPLVQESNQIQ